MDRAPSLSEMFLAIGCAASIIWGSSHVAMDAKFKDCDNTDAQLSKRIEAINSRLNAWRHSVDVPNKDDK